MRQINNFFKVLLVSTFACFTIISCEYSNIDPLDIELPPEPVSYSVKVQPAFDANCNGCHDTQSPILILGVSYNNLISGNHIDLENPESSEIYIKVTGNHYATFSAEEAAYLLKWIEEGALDN